MLLPLTNPHGWTGGWSPPARFLVPVLPFFALAVVAAAVSAPRSAVVVLAAMQIAINAYAWQHPKILWNDGDGVAAVCGRVTPKLCRYLPSVPQL